jgi:broad specificity phosphatase PhoE
MAVFFWARRALNSQKLRFPARADAPVFDRSATRVRIFTSPFLRACQTAQPLFRRLRPGELARVTVYPDLGETGGCYTAHRDNATGRLARVAPGECARAPPPPHTHTHPHPRSRTTLPC